MRWLNLASESNLSAVVKTALETFVLTENYRTEIDIRKYAKVERVLVDSSTSRA